MNRIGKRFADLKYRNKLNLFFILIGILPLLMTSIFFIPRINQILLDKAYESMEVSLNQACDTINKQIDIYNNLLNYIAFDQTLQKVLDKPQTQEYQTYREYVEMVDPVLNAPKFYHDSISQMTVYSNNIQIAHDVTLEPLRVIEGKPWFEELKTSSENIWVWSDASKNQLLAVRRFPGYRDTEAYLGMFCELKFLREALDSFKQDGAGIYLVDENKHILYSRSTNKNGHFIQTIEQLTEHYPYMKQEIKDLPLSVYIYTEQSVIYAEFWKVMEGLFLIILFCFVAIIVFGSFVSRHLVKRIEQLTTCVDQVDAGTMVLGIKDNTGDEIGILIRSFRKMLEQIQKLISEVYESKIAAQKLEMKALQAQINPHFLYNTLSMINWKAIMAGEDDISTITLALSDYYRTTLNKGETFISVDGEIKNIKSYLEIQLMMHDYDFEVTYEIASEVLTCQMPKLILQPLVENALEHGLDVKESQDKKISISCLEQEEQLVLTVCDNGIGMSKEQVDNMVRTHATGYGVKNIYDRLKLLYGEDSELEIESEEGVGTRIVVRIPQNKPIQENEVM